MLILTLLLFDSAYSQNPDSLEDIADAAVKMFTWDIQKEERGTLMFLDVPYQRDNQDSEEYLTLTVAKDKNQKRPEFISIILPNNVVQANGIFIAFATAKTNDRWKIEFEKSVKVPFEKCSEEKNTCTARIIGGYVKDDETKEKVDIFQNFMDFDHVFFLFTFPDGSHESVGVPLCFFKEQYKKL